ncbi:putative vacuolar membrane transporter for cationic amino acids [Coemansia spiralis]|uniref:Vacuolar membrane transporter for cationic amino acids n=2 Tax=Coemansia TaxID=4863 RepID=A0A9W8L527_9FUNG|nr:putative vacuolar membrane transporter for cationic amino acids [Coemansia spiralis]
MSLYLVTLQRQQMLASLQARSMANIAVDGATGGARPMNAILSDFFGYISFGCWLFVLLPQLWLNYKRKSSDGLSLGFILMWLAGDFTDWFGAYVGRLLLPAILIALYFVVTDIVLLAQMFCYRKSDDDIFGTAQLPEGAEHPPLLVRRGRRACRYSGPERAKQRLAEYREAERAALLERGLDGSSAGSSFGYGTLVPSAGTSIATTKPSALQTLRALGTADNVRAVGTSLFVLVALLGTGIGTRIFLAHYPQHVTDVVSQVFGYISAAMFFIAYIPQIAWNFTAQSTEGLSAGMFIFTVLGNVTFCMSILAMSTERDYLIAYAPWLAGAMGTLGFECLILWQCYFYSKSRQDADSDDDFGTLRRDSNASPDHGGSSASESPMSDADVDDEGSMRGRYRRRARRMTGTAKSRSRSKGSIVETTTLLRRA